MSIELHYINCRGRGQALRGQLSDASVDFQEHRYPIDNLRESWPALVADKDKTGPFAAMPVLHWNGFRLAQTLPMLSYVDAKLGLHKGRSPELIASQQMVSSAASLDITMPLALLLWQPLVHPETPMDRSIEATVKRVSAKLRQLEKLWSARELNAGPFWWGKQPSSADFATFEAWHTSHLVLGPHLEAVAGECSLLAQLETALRARPGFAQCEAKAPEQQCGSPVEMRVRESIMRDS